MIKICKYLSILLLVTFVIAEKTNNTITLNENNFVVIRGEITGQKVSKWLVELQQIKSDTIYIYISSQGGSVLDGIKIIEEIYTMRDNCKDVICVADVAMSMAFVILQACPTRYAMYSSILMQHQMSFNVGGPIRNVQTRSKFIESIDYNLNNMQATRLGIDISEFIKITSHDLWLAGKDIQKYNTVDEIVHIKCDISLIETSLKEKIITSFGEMDLIFSRCPNSREPIIIDRLDAENINENQLFVEISQHYFSG
jgi:ATP-dependent protease ClpP protease subunit